MATPLAPCIRYLVPVCCLWLLASTPARGADFLQGDWFIISGKSKLTTSIPGHRLLKDSARWVKNDGEVRILALPSDSAWLVRMKGSPWWGVNIPATLWDKNVELVKAKRDIEAVALMAQGGWAMLHDQAQLTTNGVPPAIRAQLQAAVNDMKKGDPDSRPRFLAFAPDGGWVLLGEKDYREHGLPCALSRRLAEHKEKGNAIRCVAFDCRGDWFLLDERNDCFSGNTAHAAFKKLKSLQAAGEQLRLIAFTPGVYPQGYVLEQRPVRRIEVTMSMSFHSPRGKVDRWAVFPPAFPELPRQRGVKLSYEPEATPVQDEGTLKQKAHFIRVAGKPKGFEARLRCELTLYSNRLVPLLAGQARPRAELAPADARIFTHVTEDMTTRVFKDFVARNKLHRGARESDLDFARRAYLLICKQFTYLYPEIEGKDVIECGKGDCGGLSWVFIRVLRANHIPARWLLGHWADSETPAKNGEPADTQCHAKAEFFAEGIGWVDADLSGGVFAISRGNPLVCFGNEAGDFVVCDFDIDRVVRIWPDERPTRLGGAQGFFWWYQGGARNIRTEEHWLIKTLDPHPKP